MPGKLKTIDADTLLSTPIKKTLFIVDKLLPQGMHILCGATKIGKKSGLFYIVLSYQDQDGKRRQP